MSDETKLKVLEIFESGEFIECVVGKRTVSIKINAEKNLKTKKAIAGSFKRVVH